MMLEGLLAFYYIQSGGLEEHNASYGLNWEEHETEELLSFVKIAKQVIEKRRIQPKLPQGKVRITRAFRIYFGQEELKVRPMTKTVLLLFLRHPEGILLKDILDYKDELTSIYRRVSRSSETMEIEKRVARILDLFNNDLNVNIARVNKAVSRFADSVHTYRIEGHAGHPKSIHLNEEMVIWE